MQLKQTDNHIERIQKEILSIFLEFKRICALYNLTYYAIGGTCIGAIRHKGFIPWDDDLDVAMPFEDYEIFCKIAPNELKIPYSLYTPREHKHYIYNFIKLQNDNTTLIELGCSKYPDRYTGIYIDIMPIFGLPKGGKKQKKYQAICDTYVRANRTLRLPLSSESSVRGKLFWIKHLPVRLTQQYFYYTDKIANTFRVIPFNESDKVLFGWRYMPKKRYKNYTYESMFNYNTFSGYKEVPFENTMISVPIDYDDYLTTDFGNYMQLPPEDKRVPSHPVDLLDFDKSYKEYQKMYMEGSRVW